METDTWEGTRMGATGRARRYDARERAFDGVREAMGNRGVTVGDMAAYAWDARARTYNLVYLRPRVRLTVLMAAPETGERATRVVRWARTSQRIARADVRTFVRSVVPDVYVCAGDGRTSAWKRVRIDAHTLPQPVAPGNPESDTRPRAHTCPRERQERPGRPPRYGEGRNTDAQCTRFHWHDSGARVCAAHAAERKRERAERIALLFARIDARDDA